MWGGGAMTGLVVACALAVGGCNRGVRHPPTYQDVASLDAVAAETDPKVAERMAEVQASLSFSPDDLVFLSSTGNARLMTGGGAQTTWGDRLGDQLVMDAEELDPKSPTVLVSWIDRHLTATFNRYGEVRLDREIAMRIRRLKEIDSKNSFAFYLAAYWEQRSGDHVAALVAMQAGRALSTFDSNSKQLYLAISDAAEKLGYSPFTARYHAMSYFVPTGTYSALRRLCGELISGSFATQARTECISLGRKIEVASWNTLETAIGLSLQSTAWSGAESEEGSRELRRINSRWTELNQRDGLPSLGDLTEETWLEYFRIFVDRGEEAALQYAASADPTSSR
jgi:hypothetical protein